MRNSGKRKFAITTLFFILLLFVSFYFDAKIASSMYLIKNNVLDSFFISLDSLTTILLLILILTIIFLKENRRKWILPLWIASGLSVLTSFVLKIWIQRPRPFQVGLTTLTAGLEKTRYFTWDFAFPSFHTMLIFATLPFLEKEFPKLKYFWILFAVVIGFSRMYFGLHFLSDVLAGGLIGYLIGTFMLGHKKEGKFWERLYGRIFG